jgi:hypothetical protein
MIKNLQINNDSNQATISVTRGNDDLNYTVTTTVYRGVRFANITSAITPLKANITIDWLDVIIQSNGQQVSYNDPNTICMIDNGVKALGQLVLSQLPKSTSVDYGNPTKIKIEYRCSDNPSGSFNILAGAYPLDNDSEHWTNNAVRDATFTPEITNNLITALTPVDGAEKPKYNLTIFNYRSELQTRQVDYIVCRDQAVMPKFLDDPSFSRVFINPEVAIFKVQR